MGCCCIVWLKCGSALLRGHQKTAQEEHVWGAAAGYVARWKHGCGTGGKAALHGVSAGKSRCVCDPCTPLVGLPTSATNPHPAHPLYHLQDEVRGRHGAAQGPGAGGAVRRRGLWRRGNGHQGPRLQERAPVERPRLRRAARLGKRKELAHAAAASRVSTYDGSLRKPMPSRGCGLRSGSHSVPACRGCLLVPAFFAFLLAKLDCLRCEC